MTSDNPPVVVLHPAGLDGRCADFLDLPGTTAPTLVPPTTPDTPLSLRTMAEEVAKSLTEPAHVVGLSMGGMVAQHLALAAPELVRSLVLACTTSNPDRTTMLERSQFTRTASRREILDDTLPRWFSASGLRRGGPPIDYARDCLERIPQPVFAQVWAAIADHDLDAMLGRIRVPTTCLAGSTDVSTPVAEMHRVGDLIACSRLDIIDGPHLAFLETPSTFARRVQDHIEWATRTERTSETT